MSDCTNNIIVMLSGGMDSTVLLHHLRKVKGDDINIHALSIHYGQRHVRELVAARYQASAVRAQFHELNLSVLADILREGSTLIAGAQAVPDLESISESNRSQPPTYVPNRNMILLSVAGAFAETHEAKFVYYGAQAQDEYGYWDCTQDFLQRINEIFKLNRKNQVVIKAPFLDWKKAEIVQRGRDLGVDFSKTWSCYRGGMYPCNTCPTCVERSKAFAACNISDPLQNNM